MKLADKDNNQYSLGEVKYNVSVTVASNVPRYHLYFGMLMEKSKNLKRD